MRTDGLEPNIYRAATLEALKLRLSAAALLATMAAIAKLLNEHGVALMELLFFRQVFALPIIAGWIAVSRGTRPFRTARLDLHISRATLGVLGIVANFGAVILLPITEAAIISFTAPTIATLLSAVFLGEMPGWRRCAATLLGFAGIVIALSGSSSAAPLPVLGLLVALASAIIVAGTSIFLRQIGRTEAPSTTVFWFTVLPILPLAAGYPFYGRGHEVGDWILLGILGVTGGLGQLALTASVSKVPISAVVPMDYTSLLWAAVFGWVIWSTMPTSSSLMGAAVVIASGLFALHHEKRFELQPRSD